MDFLFLLIFIVVAVGVYYYISNQPQPVKQVEEKPKETFKVLVFVSDHCGACQNYKATKHEELKNELLKDGVEMELIENNENAFKHYEIQWFPTFIVEKNNRLMKLSMEDPPTYDNIMNVSKIMV